MKNKISIQEDLNPIQKLAIMGFLFGGDNFGEEVIGIRDELEYDEIQKGYSMTVLLRESDSHTSTSGIGFYLRGNKVMVYSSGEVITVGLTDEITKIFDKAKNKGYGQY